METIEEVYQSIKDKSSWWKTICPEWPDKACEVCSYRGGVMLVVPGTFDEITCRKAVKRLEATKNGFAYKVVLSQKITEDMVKEYLEEAHEIYMKEEPDYEALIAIVEEMNE